MPIKFIPSGFLNVQTDPLRLPSQLVDKTELSDAMTRCTNLHLDNAGTADTRRGTKKASSVAVDHLSAMLEMNGDRYEFSGTKFYKNETLISSSLTAGLWSGVISKAFNATVDSIFVTNETDTKRITGSTINKWGIDAPTLAPNATDQLIKVAYSYVQQSGLSYLCETSLSPYCTINNWRGTKITWTPSTDLDCNIVILYRTKAGGSTYYWENTFLNTTNNAFLLKTDDELSVPYPIASPSSCGTISAPSVSPQYTQAGYIYGTVYTYLRKEGSVIECESNHSPVVLHNSVPYSLSWTASSDPQVTHVKIYRSLLQITSPGTTYYYAGEYAIGTTSATIAGEDSSLGSAAEIDHDPPPAGSFLFGPGFLGVVFIVKNNSLYFTKQNEPEYCSAFNYVEVSPPEDPLVGGAFFGSTVYVASSHAIYQVQGTGTNTFFPLPTNCITGTKSRHCFQPVGGQGIFHLGNDGIYLFSGNDDTKITGSNFDPIFFGETTGSIPSVDLTKLDKCWMYHFQNRLYFGYCSESDDYPNQILRVNISNLKAVHYQYPVGFSLGLFDRTNSRLLMQGNDGHIYQMDDPSMTTDNGVDIAWQIQTKAFGGLRKQFPRRARYDVELVDSTTTATSSILLDDSVKQIHPLPESRKLKNRLITTSMGDRVAIRISGTGPVKIHSLELE